MRRHRPTGLAVPERLARFIVSEWPSGCEHEALELWFRACVDWLAEGSSATPPLGGDERSARIWLAGRSSRRLPFGECGGGLDLIREHYRIRRELGPCPRESADAPSW